MKDGSLDDVIAVESLGEKRANAAPEWQAMRLGWLSRELMGACPLEGCVRSVASLQITSADLRLNCKMKFIHGVTKGIICLP